MLGEQLEGRGGGRIETERDKPRSDRRHNAIYDKSKRKKSARKRSGK